MTDVASASIGVVPVPLARDIEEEGTCAIEVGRDVLGLTAKDVEPAVGVDADAETKLEGLATRVRGSSFVEGEDKGDKASFEEKDIENEPEDSTIANGLEAKAAVEPETTTSDAKGDEAVAAVISSEETEQPAIDGETHAAPRVVSDVVVSDRGERASAPEHATQPLTEVGPKAKDAESTVETTKAKEDSPEPPSVGDVEVPAKEEDPIEAEEVTQSQAVEEHVQAPSAVTPAKEEETVKIGEIEDEQAVEETSRDGLPTAEETEDKPGLLEVEAETEAPRDVEEPSKEELINTEDVSPAAGEGEPVVGQEPTETETEVTNDVKNTEAAAAKPDAVEDLTAGEHPIPAEQDASAPVVAAEIIPAASDAELQASESVPDVKPESEELVQPVVKEVEAGVLAPVAETYDEATDTKTSSESGVESLSSVPTETGDTPSVAPDEHTAPSIPEEAVGEERDAIEEPEAVHVSGEVGEKPRVELIGAIPADDVNASLPEPEEEDKSVDSQVVEREAVLGEEHVDAATSLEAEAGETEVEVLAPEDAIIEESKPEETSEATELEKVDVEQSTDVATSVNTTLVDEPGVKTPEEEHLLSSDNVELEEKDDTPIPATTLPSDVTPKAPSEVVNEVITGAPEESEVNVLAEEVKETHNAPPGVSIEPIADETPAVATNEVGGPTEGPSDELHVTDAAPPADEAVEPESNKQGEPIPAESQEDVRAEKETKEPHVRGLEDESKSHQADIATLNEEEQDTSEAITSEAVPDGKATLAEELTTVESSEAIQVQSAREPIQQDVSETVDIEETTLAEELTTTEPTEAIKEEPATDAGQQDISNTVIDETVNAEEPAPATIEPAKVDEDELARELAQQDVSESIGAGVNSGEDTLAEESVTSVPAAESVQQDASESVNDDSVNVAEPALAEAELAVSVDESTNAAVQQDVSESIIDEVVNAGETNLAELSRTAEPSEAIEESAKIELTEVIEKKTASEPLRQDVSESIIDVLTEVESAEVNEGESTTEVVQQVAYQPTVNGAGDVGKVILVEAPATTEPGEAIEESPEESSQEALASETQATESEEPLVEPSTDAESGQVGSTEVEIPVSANAQGSLENVVQEPPSTGQAEEGKDPAEPVITKTLEDPVALQSDNKVEHVTELVQEETAEVESEMQVAPAEVPIEQESAVLQEPAAVGNADVTDEASVPAVVAAESVDMAALAPGGITTGMQEENEGTELHVEDDRSITDTIVTKEMQAEEQTPTSREVLEGTEQVSVAVEEPEVAREDTDEAAGETEVQIVGPDEGQAVELAEHVGEGAQDPGLLDEPIPNVQVELPTPSLQTLSLTSEEDDQVTEVPLEHRLAEAIGIPPEEIVKLPALSSPESSEVIASTFEEETTMPTDTKVQTVADETQEKEETLADVPTDDPEALAKALHSEQPSITFETETNAVPDDRSVEAEVPERPKSPWAPSYSVTTQGASPVHPPEEEQIAKELDVYPTESVPQSTMEPVVETASAPTEAIVPPSDATPLINAQIPEPVTEGDVQAVPKKDDALTDEEEALVGVAAAATLSVDTEDKEIPERPKSPWTPSYTVTMQGPGIPEPEELVLDAEPDLAGAVEEKGEAIQVTPPADDISVSAQEIARPKSPYPPSYSVTQMGPGIGEENGVLNEAEEVGSVVSSNDPEAPSTPRSDLGAITPGFDSRSEVSESSDVPIAPSSPRSDPEVTSLAEREIKTPLALGAEDHDTTISPLHTPLSSADKTLEGDLEGEPELAEPLTELAVSGFNGDRNGNQTAVTGSWIKATDNERDTQVPESEAPLPEDGADETIIQTPELSKETKPSVTTIPKLDVTVAPPIAQPVIVTNSLSTDSAYTQMSDSLSPSQETGTNVTTPDVDTFSISKGDTFVGSDVESIEPLDEETVSHFSDRTRTPTGPEAGAKPLGVAQTLAMRSFPSAFSNNGANNSTSADQSKQAPVVESLEVNDQLSSLSSRRRLESTVSSIAFPGGWISTPPQKERPSLEFATGEFSRPIIDGTPVPPAVTPAVVAEASPEKESKWRCVIM